MYSTKMRIKLFNPESKALEYDRLVEQAPEFIKGPTHAHEGPITLEVTLLDKQDVDSVITYIGKLAGTLPLTHKEEKKLKKNKALEQALMSDEPLKEFMQIALASENQEALIDTLRESNFRFMSYLDLKDLTEESKSLTLKTKHSDWQFMVRLIKEAKNPINDKWDTRLVFAIKYMGERVNLVHVYLWGQWDQKRVIPWKTKPGKEINFKDKPQFFQFPEFMTYEERGKFRAEHRKLALIEDPTKREPSKFFNRWAPYVPGSLEFKLK